MTILDTRRRMTALGAALVALTVLTGCGSSAKESTTGSTASSTGKKIKTIAYADPTSANPQFKAVGDVLVSEAKKQGIEVFRFDNDLDATTTLNNARLMVQRRPDMIIDWSAAASANPAVGKLFKDAGIPCIALNVGIPSCNLFNQVSRDLGTDLAKTACMEAASRGWTADDTTLLIVWAPLAGAEVNELATHFYSTYAAKFAKMKQVAPADIPLSTTRVGDNAVFVDGAGALQQTDTAVKQALQSTPAGRHLVVVTLNDESGLGAKRAIKSAGREGDAFIVSNVASKEGLAQLRNDKNWVAEGSIFFELWGKYALAMALAKADGQTMPEFTGSPQAVLTPETVGQFYDGDSITKAPDHLPSNTYLAPYLEQLGGALPS